MSKEHIQFNLQYSSYDREERVEQNNKIIKYLKLDNGKPKHILDLGCGLGDLSRQLLNLGHSVVSVNGYMGWHKQYLHADAETKYNNVKINQYNFEWDTLSKTNEQIENLKSYSNQKYDYVICKRFSMHLIEQGPRKLKMCRETTVNKYHNVVTPAVSEDKIFQIYLEFINELRQVCKRDATVYIGFNPPFTTHNGYGSKDLLKYSLPKWEGYEVSGLGMKVLRFTLNDK